MPWKLGKKTIANEEEVPSTTAGLTVFYSDVAISDEADVSCWLAPEGDEKGVWICARDVTLWDEGESSDDSY